MRLTVRLCRGVGLSRQVIPIPIAIATRPCAAVRTSTLTSTPVFSSRLSPAVFRTMSSSTASATGGAATIEPQAGRKLYVAFMPDSEEKGTMARRFSVRPKHFERFNRMKGEGVFVFGRGFVPPANSPLHADPGVPEGGTALVGSVMILHAENLDEAWSIIKDDIYWTEGVWDREKGRVEEFIQM